MKDLNVNSVVYPIRTRSKLLLWLVCAVLTFGLSVARGSAQPAESAQLVEAGFHSVPLAESQRAYRQLTGRETDAPVILFMTSWCPYCRALEQDLQRAGIPFAHADIERDGRAAALFRSFGDDTGGIPVTVVGDKVISGYQPEVILGELSHLRQRSRAQSVT